MWTNQYRLPYVFWLPSHQPPALAVKVAAGVCKWSHCAALSWSKGKGRTVPCVPWRLMGNGVRAVILLNSTVDVCEWLGSCSGRFTPHKQTFQNYGRVIGHNRNKVWRRKRMLQYAAVCCSMLQYVAVCCSMLQYVAVYCSMLQYVAVCCIILQYVALCCRMLHYVSLCCSMLQYAAVCCSMLQYVAVCCSMLQYVALRCSMLQYVALCSNMLQYVAVCRNMLHYIAVCCSMLLYVAVRCIMFLCFAPAWNRTPVPPTSIPQPTITHYTNRLHKIHYISRSLRVYKFTSTACLHPL